MYVSGKITNAKSRVTPEGEVMLLELATVNGRRVVQLEKELLSNKAGYATFSPRTVHVVIDPETTDPKGVLKAVGRWDPIAPFAARQLDENGLLALSRYRVVTKVEQGLRVLDAVLQEMGKHGAMAPIVKQRIAPQITAALENFEMVTSHEGLSQENLRQAVNHLIQTTTQSITAADSILRQMGAANNVQGRQFVPYDKLQAATKIAAGFLKEASDLSHETMRDVKADTPAIRTQTYKAFMDDVRRGLDGINVPDLAHQATGRVVLSNLNHLLIASTGEGLRALKQVMGNTPDAKALDEDFRRFADQCNAEFRADPKKAIEDNTRRLKETHATLVGLAEKLPPGSSARRAVLDGLEATRGAMAIAAPEVPALPKAGFHEMEIFESKVNLAVKSGGQLVAAYIDEEERSIKVLFKDGGGLRLRMNGQIDHLKPRAPEATVPQEKPRHYASFNMAHREKRDMTLEQLMDQFGKDYLDGKHAVPPPQVAREVAKGAIDRADDLDM